LKDRNSDVTPRTIKVVRGGSNDLSTARLEIACAQLLRARVCRHTAQIGFNFLQKLLNEVLRRRREEEEIGAEIHEILKDMDLDPDDYTETHDLVKSCEITESGAQRILKALSEMDDMNITAEAWAGEGFDFTGLEITDLKQVGESSRIEMVEVTECPEAETIDYKRRPVLACSKPRTNYWASGLNLVRVMVISFLVVAVMIFGVLLVGCGPHKRPKVYVTTHVTQVGPLCITYEGSSTREQRALLRNAAGVVVKIYELDHGDISQTLFCEVIIGTTDEPPCDTTDGATHTFATHRIRLMAGKWDDLPGLYHALHHSWLHYRGESPERNANHKDKSWGLVHERTRDLRIRFCAPVTTKGGR